MKSIIDSCLALKNIYSHLTVNNKTGSDYYQIGCSLSFLGYSKKAIKYFETALKNGFSIDDLYFRLGNEYDNTKHIHKAIECYNKAIEMNIVENGIYYNRGKMYQQIFNLELSDNDFLKSIQINDMDAKSYIGLGWNSYCRKEFEMAKYYINKGISINPSYKKYVPVEIKEIINI